MGSRGRKSQADLSVVGSTDAVDRPAPPEELTSEQKQVWLNVVNSLPADHFGEETLGALIQLCRHTVSARRIEQLSRAEEQSEDFDLSNYDRIRKMAERESRMISSLMVKLRISPSTTDDRRDKGKRGKNKLLEWQ